MITEDDRKHEKQGIDNVVMNGDIHHPDKIDNTALPSQANKVNIQSSPSPIRTVEQRNNNNNIKNHSKQLASNRQLSQQQEEQQLLLRPVTDICLPVHDDEKEYIIDFPSAEQAGDRQHLCAQHEALAAAADGGNRSINSHSHVSAFVSAPVSGRVQKGQNGHAANRKDKRNTSNRKTPIRQRLIINLDDKNKFTEEVTV